MIQEKQQQINIYFTISTQFIVLLFICHLGNNIRTLDTENRTKEDCNQDSTGIQRVISYDYRSPNKPCYKQFFVRGLPPSHLRDISNGDIRYICQPPTPQPPEQQAQQTYYATMFDEFRGIAVFSAYTLTQPSQARVSARRPHPWCRTPGNLLIEVPHPSFKVPTYIRVNVLSVT